MMPIVSTTVREVDGRSIYRRSTEVVCRNIGAEAILVPIRNNVGNLDFVYTLSPVAARIWSLLDGTRNADAVIETICTEYEVSRDVALADLGDLVSDLAEVSLITRQT
jgi:hypothetical protein